MPLFNTASGLYVGADEVTAAYLGATQVYPSEPPVGVEPLDPDEIATLVQWFNAGDLSLSDGDPVSLWGAAVGNDATQASPTYQPIYKTAIVNGEPVVRWDGTPQFMAFSGLGYSLSQFTVFTVYRPDTLDTANDNNGMTILSQDAGGYSNDLLFGLDPESSVTTNGRTAMDLQKSSGSSRIVATDTVDTSITDFGIYVARYDGSALQIYRNSGTPSASVSGTGYTVANRTWNLGRNPQNYRWLDGDLAEVGIYSTAIDDDDMDGLIAGLLAKYDIDA